MLAVKENWRWKFMGLQTNKHEQPQSLIQSTVPTLLSAGTALCQNPAHCLLCERRDGEMDHDRWAAQLVHTAHCNRTWQRSEVRGHVHRQRLGGAVRRRKRAATTPRQPLGGMTGVARRAELAVSGLASYVIRPEWLVWASYLSMGYAQFF